MSTARQSRIAVPRPALPNPADFDCEWCGEKATALFQLKRKKMGTQQFIFTCNKHREKGEKAVTPKPRENN